MRALVTGLSGTVAPVLAEALAAAGHHVVPWDRAQVPTDDPAAVRAFVAAERPDWAFHLATGSLDWAEALARACAEQGVRFLFTSSVSVFGGAQQGPFAISHVPRPDDDYGRYKHAGEERVHAAHPDARIARLGWQIGDAPGGNQMVDNLHRTFQSDGQIVASVNWYQACSFLPDTAAALVQIMEAETGGLYHVDGNPGLNFYEVASGLNRMLGRPWVVVPGEAPALDNRLLDERIRVQPITERFHAGG